jgi:2-oxoglutarate ferredoxin oxidoreductase subunit alpha
LLVNEFELDPARVEPVLHYDGTPITARFIVREIEHRLGTGAKVVALNTGRKG